MKQKGKRRRERRGVRKLVIGAVLLIVFAGAFQFWFRDSSLVEVETVHVHGLESDDPRSREMREKLVAAGRSMTTLAIDEGSLARAVSGYPEVSDVTADGSFPSTLDVEVELRRPVARIGDGEEARAVARDGVILDEGYAADADVPALPLDEPPDKPAVEGPVRDQVAVLAAAPSELLPVVEETGYSEETGPVAHLEGGIELRFGDHARAGQKWEAAVSVLTDPGLERLSYIDLSSPMRPAVGGDEHELPQSW